jgi:hypothetical protein
LHQACSGHTLDFGTLIAFARSPRRWIGLASWHSLALTTGSVGDRGVWMRCNAITESAADHHPGVAPDRGRRASSSQAIGSIARLTAHSHHLAHQGWLSDRAGRALFGPAADEIWQCELAASRQNDLIGRDHLTDHRVVKRLVSLVDAGPVSGDWKRIQRAAKLDETYRFHDLRVSFCTNLVAAGVEAPRLMNLARHSPMRRIAGHLNEWTIRCLTMPTKMNRR